jgi:cytidylate kinase
MASPRRIAIDGPAGAGKSTIGALVAERLGYGFLDTGAMYRAVALLAHERGLSPDSEQPLAEIASSAKITIGPPTVRDGRAYSVLVGGRDITWAIRDAEVDRTVSQVARHPSVREAMVEQQRRIAARGRLVMVGRDIGTVVLPDADLKIFLTASAAERARRRGEELAARGIARSREELFHEILRRDQLDSARPVAPLRAAEDAVIVETDGHTVGEALERVLLVIASRSR